MAGRHGRTLVFMAILALAGCSSGSEGASPARSDATASFASGAESTQPPPRDLAGLGDFAALQPGSYVIDPDTDPSTSLRVAFDITADGWSAWIGAVKFGDQGHVAVTITTVVNLVSHGCRDHGAADPPIGPTVDDLATALADLEPFELTSPPTDVTLDGYTGKHLALRVPDIRFDRCDAGDLRSWIAPMDVAEEGDAFYGYTGPGYREDFWILDVDGTRLVIAAERSAGSPRQDVTELRDILHSIRIEA